MHLNDFKLERYFAKYEFTTKDLLWSIWRHSCGRKMFDEIKLVSGQSG